MPPESREAGLLLLELFSQLKSSYSSSFNQKVTDYQINDAIPLLFQLTGAIEEETRQLLAEAEKGADRSGERPDYRTIDFYEKVLEIAIEGPHSEQLCKYLPAEMLGLLKRHLAPLSKEESHGFPSHEDKHSEDLFGIRYDSDLKWYPASAYQTSLYYLLRYDTVNALAFIVTILNDCTAFYKDRKVEGHPPVVQVELTLNDGTIITQWGNLWLWQLYRGGSNLPNFLQSILMALEKFMLELAMNCGSKGAAQLKEYFDYLYRNSTSITTTAVLASVATAFPAHADDSVLPILASKQCIQWDEQRYVNDVMPDHLFSGENSLHDIERRESRRLRHRRIYKGLNGLAASLLYLGWVHGPELLEILDNFHKEAEGSTEIYWLKTLTEMDARRREGSEVPEEPGKVLLTPAYDGIVKEFLDSGRAQEEQSGVEAGYHNWIGSAYKKETKAVGQYAKWKTICQFYSAGKITEPIFAKTGSLAIIGLRDLAGKLTQKEKQWCIKAIYDVIKAVVLDREERNTSRQMDGMFKLQDVKPCLEFVPFLFKVVTKGPELLALKKFVLGLLLSGLHDHELNALLFSIQFHLWKINPVFAQRCVNFMLTYAEMRRDKEDWYTKQDYFRQKNEAAEQRDTTRLINLYVGARRIPFDFSKANVDHYTHHYLSIAFVLIPPGTKNLELFNFCYDLTRQHIDLLGGTGWDREMNYYQDRHLIKILFSAMVLHMKPVHGRQVIDDLFKNYAEEPKQRWRFGIPQPNKDFIAEIIQHTIVTMNNYQQAKDSQRLTNNFWLLLARLHELNVENKSYHFSKYLLLDINWEEPSLQWAPLAGKAAVLTSYIKYYGEDDLGSAFKLMATIGDTELMPRGISLLADILRGSRLSTHFLGTAAAVSFIKRCFYFYGRQIKSTQALLIDFCYILDIMVETGSEDAYQIRENLVTFKMA